MRDSYYGFHARRLIERRHVANDIRRALQRSDAPLRPESPAFFAVTREELLLLEARNATAMRVHRNMMLRGRGIAPTA
jgi:hypothetical protein